MSIIVKRQKKKDRGYNFKIMNRDVDDPLFHNPNVPNKVLIHAPTRSEMKMMRKQKNRDLPDYLQTVNDTYDEMGEFEEDKDQVDYALEEFQKKVEEQEGEGEGDGEGDYEFDEFEFEAEGDDDYEFLGYNNKLDKEFAEEVKQNFKYKPAEGVKMVEYDAYGLPKTEELEKIKKELNMKDDDVFRENGSQVLFIKPPEEYILHGHHKNVDILRKDMNNEMREVFDMMEEVDNEVPEEDCIDDDFLAMLNDNQPALREKNSNDEYEELSGCDDFDEFEDMGEGDEEAMRKAKEEADAFLKNMPVGLSEEMQMRLAGAREFLANKKAMKTDLQSESQAEIDDVFQDVMEEYQDDEIGAIQDDLMGPMSDMIDQDAFDEIMQEFIETNKDYCKKLYEKYHDEDFRTKVTVEGDAIEEIVDKDGEFKDKVYKILKQKNGEIVKLVPKEEMQHLQEKLHAEEIEANRAALKAKILKYHEDQLRAEAEMDSEEEEQEAEGEDQEQKKWDVETILSTRTNTDNHPGLIKSVVKIKKNRIVLDPKTRAPELEDGATNDKPAERPSKEGPYREEEVSDSDDDIDVEGQEIPNLESMSEKERTKYLRKLNKKQVKKEKKDRRQMKKKMKEEFSKQKQRFNQINTTGRGEIRPGTSVRKL